jgi:hypothetical protein
VLQALHSVATVFLADEELPQQLREPIVQHMVKVHQSVRGFSTKFLEELRRYNYVTVRHRTRGRGGCATVSKHTVMMLPARRQEKWGMAVPVGHKHGSATCLGQSISQIFCNILHWLMSRLPVGPSQY